MTKSGKKTKRNASKQELFEDMVDKLKKKAEAKRKRLIKKRETALVKARKRKEKQQEDEDHAEEERIIENYKKEIEAADEQAKEFYPDKSQWAEYVRKSKEDFELFAQKIRGKRSNIIEETQDTKSKDQETEKESDRHKDRNETARLTDGELESEDQNYTGENSYEVLAVQSEGDEQAIEEEEAIEEEVRNKEALKAKEALAEHIRSNSQDYKENNCREDKEKEKETGYNSDDTMVAGSPNKTNSSSKKKAEKSVLKGHTKLCMKYNIFCKVKIGVKKSENATSTMKQAMGNFMTTLLKIDKELVIYKYKDRSCTSYINRPTQIPETPSKIREFFFGRYRPKRESQTIWMEIKIGINSEPDNFFEDARCLLVDKPGQEDCIYKKDLQAEVTSEIGFFLFSNQWQDRKRLTASIKKKVQEDLKFTPEFTLKWKKAFDPTIKRGKMEDKLAHKKQDEVKAIYIEVIGGQEETISRAVSKIYSSTKKTYLDGEKMRFIPSPKFTQNSGLHVKYSDIIQRQSWYLKGIQRATTFELTNLDHKPSELKKSAREIIMAMVTENGQQMFTSVDKSWDNGTVLTFPVMYATEARNRIADLGPFLHFHYGDIALVRYFTPEAAQRACESPWNEQEGRAISKVDEEFDEILRDCSEIDWLKAPMDGKAVVEFTTQANISQPIFNHIPNDDKSLETFGNETTESTRSGQKRTTPVDMTINNPTMKKQKKDKVRQEDMETEELTDDDNTIDTMMSKISTLESGLEGLQSQMASMLSLLTKEKTNNDNPREQLGTAAPNSKDETSLPTGGEESP